MKKACLFGVLGIGFLAIGLSASSFTIAQEQEKPAQSVESLDWQLPNEDLMTPFEDQIPIQFVTRTSDIQTWLGLKDFWTEATETAINPKTGKEVTRKVIKLKVPLGLNQAPTIPSGNEMTLDRWVLGKKLYFDGILSSDSTVSCASCHDPERGWTDQSPVSIGIGGLKGGVSAPPVLNSAYNKLQFWDGRAQSLEDQAQGPPGNPVEMFSGKGHAWNDAVRRIRKIPSYLEGFKKAYGTEPTRDTIAKAIALYERTVLGANAIYDRADFAKAIRAAEEGITESTPKAVDYETVLKEALEMKDKHSLSPLGINGPKDVAKIPAIAKSLANGQTLFFGKARCNSCHVGDNFTDNEFHNLGVGVTEDGKIPVGSLGRFGALPTGHKDPATVGAFKTSGLRGLLSTFPYMHDGSERTLEEVVEFYDRGGNPNRYLDPKMRDFEAEKAYYLAKKNGKEYTGPKAYVFGPDNTVVVPFKLNLTADEKKDLVLFMKALQGDPVPSVVSDPQSWPPIAGKKE